ncbi:MAG: EAL domain-containing protein [Chloroflexi bacterium]|nr:EAL domain-containing protein [Chloroflexota bacterium]
MYDQDSELNRLVHLLGIQRDLIVDLSTLSQLQPALERILSALRSIQDVDQAAIYLFDAQSEGFNLAVQSGFSPQELACMASFAGDSTEVQMLLHGRPVLFNSGKCIVPDPEAETGQPSGAVVACPVMEGKHVAAVTIAASQRLGQFSPELQAGICSIASQISGVLARLHVEEKSRQIKNNLLNLFESMEDFLFILHPDGKIYFCSASVPEALGYRPDELSGMNILDLYPPDHRPEALAGLQQVAGGAMVDQTIPLRTRRGELLPVETHVALGQWGYDRMVFSLSRDIRKRHQVEEALKTSEMINQKIVQYSEDGIVLIDERGKIIGWNDGQIKNCGYGREDALGKNWWDVQFLLAPDERKSTTFYQKTRQTIEHLLATGKSPNLGKIKEYVIQRADGRQRTMQSRTFTMPTPSGFLVSCIIRDITERIQVMQELRGLNEELEQRVNERTLDLWEEINARERAQQALKNSEENYRRLVEEISDTIYVLDQYGVFSYISPVVERVFEYTPGEMLGHQLTEFIHLEDLPAMLDSFVRARAGRVENQEFRVRTKYGQTRWIRNSTQPIYEMGRYLGLRGILRDVTQRKKAELELQVRVNQQAAIARFSQEATAGMEYQTLLNLAVNLLAQYLNVDYTEILELMHERNQFLLRAGTGWREGMVGSVTIPFEANTLAGYTLVSQEPVIINELSSDSRFQKPNWLLNYEITSGMSVIINGRQYAYGVIAVFTTHPRVFSQDDIHFLEAVANVLASAIDRKRAEERLVYDALHDSLTGLPNQMLLMDRVGRAIERMRMGRGRYAVLFLDFDHFKKINDSLGHHAGDQLLIEVPRRLSTCVRDIDTLSRFGGDEFIVLREDIESPEEVHRLAEMILDKLNQPFQLGGQEVYTSVSIGVVMGNPAYTRAEEVLRDADIGMYQAKASGKSQWVLFDESMRTGVMGRLEMETDLRRAIQQQKLAVYYQPIYSLTLGRVTGFEALARWPHPGRGMIMPDEFIPIAEETGLIVALDRWVIRQACHQVRTWQTCYPSDPPWTINLNLCGKHITHPDFVEFLEQVLAESGLSGEYVHLEITESMLLENTEATIAALERIRATGVKIYIDDFGTGYSSLSYLRQLPVDAIKIDRSFTQEISERNENLEIVHAILRLARHLKIFVVAEGVETAEQEKVLKDLHCDYEQGFLISEPLPAGQIEATVLKPREDKE